MNRISLWFLVGAGLLLMAGTTHADIITFKNGRQVEGKILKETSFKLKIKLTFGIQTFNRNEIVSIVYERSAHDEYQKRVKEIATADQHFKLGVWCEENDLPVEARVEFKKAIKKDIFHADARKKLGYEWRSGKWQLTRAAKEKIQEEEAEEKENNQDSKMGIPPLFVKKGQNSGSMGGAVRRIPGPFKKFTQEQSLKMQQDHAEETRRLFGPSLMTYPIDIDTSPIMVHSTHASTNPEFKKFWNLVKGIYKTQKMIFNIKDDADLWPGKLQFFFFKTRHEFEGYTNVVNEIPGPVKNGGYFWDSWIKKGGQTRIVFHIAMFNLDPSTLAHEISHAFTSRYNNSQARVNPWLNEGTAEFMAAALAERNTRTSKGDHMRRVKELLRINDYRVSVNRMFQKPRIEGTEVWAYSLGWSMVDCMIEERRWPGQRKRGQGFVKFLKLLKNPDGPRGRQPTVSQQEDALNEALGVTSEQFEVIWKARIRKYKP